MHKEIATLCKLNIHFGFIFNFSMQFFLWQLLQLQFNSQTYVCVCKKNF